MRPNQLLVGIVSLIILGFAGYRMTQWLGESTSGRVDYPYWCEQRHVYSASEVEQAGRERHPASSSPGVIVCIQEGCEAPAYPANQCAECGTYYLLEIRPEGECPVCHPAVAKEAREAGVDLTPAELKDWPPSE